MRASAFTPFIALSAAVTLLAGCQSGATESAGAEGGGWSYTPPGLPDRTVTLEAAPEVLLVDGYSAGALWDYGIRPDGVFGYGFGEGELGIGNADVSQMTVVSEAAEFDLEAAAALDPDVIIGFGNEAVPAWQWWDEDVAANAEEIAPFLPVKFNGPVDETISAYADLAAALGADTDSEEIVAERERYEAGRDRLKELAAEKPDFRILPVSADSVLYLGTTGLGQIALLEELGFTIAGPESDGEMAWAEESWENLGDYPADLVLEYGMVADQLQEQPSYASLPAVQAGQIAAWDDKRAYTYASYADWFEELATAIESAQPID